MSKKQRLLRKLLKVVSLIILTGVTITLAETAFSGEKFLSNLNLVNTKQLCHMQRADGTTVNLDQLCKKSSGASATEARADDRTKPVLLVHGIDAVVGFLNCANPNLDQNLGKHKSGLISLGYSDVRTVAYYGGDVNCDVSISNSGSDAVHQGPGRTQQQNHPNGHHSNQTSIEHLAYHLAWYVYDTFSSRNVAIDVMGYSMGGLIARYAIDKVQRGDPDFPAYLLVEDVVSLETPHNGLNPYTRVWCSTLIYECVELGQGSSFLNTLNQGADNPQGKDGTDWTNIGSYADVIVNSESAIAMNAAHKFIYSPTTTFVDQNGKVKLYGHLEIVQDTSDQPLVQGWYSESGGPWTFTSTAKRSVRRVDDGLRLGTQ